MSSVVVRLLLLCIGWVFCIDLYVDVVFEIFFDFVCIWVEFVDFVLVVDEEV